MTASFDDGHPEVPDGIVRPVDRVLVVGAGIAGLTVANAMAHAGVDCVVLEARSRIGGRLHTVDLDGSSVDLGGSWLHHPDGNPLHRFARTAGIECRPGNPMATLAGFDCGLGRWLSSAELDAGAIAVLDDFTDSLDSLRLELGPHASAAEAIAAYTGHLTGDPRRRTRQGLRSHVEADAAGAAERQSLAWLWTQEEYSGDYFGDLPDGGYAAVVDAMAAGLDVRRDWPVAQIMHTTDGVTLTSADGATESGSHVVVTVPLGVLQHDLPRFEPALPPERIDVIRRLGFGRYEKVALAFERAFWRDAGWSHLVLFPSDEAEPAAWVFDLDAFGAGPVLVCHVFHSATDRLHADSVIDMLGAALGAPCPAPTEVAATSWTNDPFSRGAYTHVPQGCSNADVDLLGTPVGGRVLFAGEHTQSARLGYADGAMTSGIREAKRLLGRPTVTLGGFASGRQNR